MAPWQARQVKLSALAIWAKPIRGTISNAITRALLMRPPYFCLKGIGLFTIAKRLYTKKLILEIIKKSIFGSLGEMGSIGQ
jgi:hypothetical protein